MSRDSIDCAFIEKSELCYECTDCQECYDCGFSQDLVACSTCEWCYDCKGCQNCYGSVNLRNKQFHIFNKPYSKEDYFRIVAELKKKHANIDQPPPEWLELKRTQPHNAMQGVQNENVIGDHIFRSRNVFYGFDVSDQEDTMFAFNASNNKDSLDFCNAGQGSELIYMCHSAVALYNSNFCNVCWFSQNLEYCEYVFNSHDCFGCVGRNHAEYEILNQKYSKKDYFKKVAEIREELKSERSYGRWWWPSPYPEQPSAYLG